LIFNTENIRYSAEKIKKKAYGFVRDSLREYALLAQKRGIMLCVENMGLLPNHVIYSIEGLSRLVKEVCNSLKVAFDLGHAHLSGDIIESIKVSCPYALTLGISISATMRL
jgi:sugar phosphate isomerase/epimerase